MRQYFEKMPSTFGKKLDDSQIKSASENIQQIKDEEKKLAEAVATVKNAGIPAEAKKPSTSALNCWLTLAPSCL